MPAWSRVKRGLLRLLLAVSGVSAVTRVLTWTAVLARDGKIGVLCKFRPWETQAVALDWLCRAVERGAEAASDPLVDIRPFHDVDEIVEWFRFRANGGCPHSQYNLATIQHHGLGVLPDLQAAYTWYCIASEQGLAMAWFQRGILVATGAESEGDLGDIRFSRACAYFQKAAEQGHSAARDYLQAIRRNMLRVPKHDIRAYPWYHAFAEQGNADAQFMLGRLFYSAQYDLTWSFNFTPAAPRDSYNRAREGACDEGYRLGVRQHRSEMAAAVGWLHKAATAGHAKAQRRLGDIYFEGIGMEEHNTDMALEWWHAAAKQGHVKAQLRLANWHAQKENLEDHAQALELYKRAADLGNRKAMYLLGCHYREGDVVTRNKQEAAGWFRRAAAKGYAKAQHALGNLYDDSECMPQDLTKAIYWWERAARQGDALAAYNIGLMHINGVGVLRDPIEAVYWIRKSAKAGDSHSCYVMGLMYHVGFAVPAADEAKAKVWYEKAQSLDDGDGGPLLAPQNFAEAQEELNHCFRLHSIEPE